MFRDNLLILENQSFLLNILVNFYCIGVMILFFCNFKKNYKFRLVFVLLLLGLKTIGFFHLQRVEFYLSGSIFANLEDVVFFFDDATSAQLFVLLYNYLVFLANNSTYTQILCYFVPGFYCLYSSSTCMVTNNSLTVLFNEENLKSFLNLKKHVMEHAIFKKSLPSSLIYGGVIDKNLDNKPYLLDLLQHKLPLNKGVTYSKVHDNSFELLKMPSFLDEAKKFHNLLFNVRHLSIADQILHEFKNISSKESELSVQKVLEAAKLPPQSVFYRAEIKKDLFNIAHNVALKNYITNITFGPKLTLELILSDVKERNNFGIQPLKTFGTYYFNLEGLFLGLRQEGFKIIPGSVIASEGDFTFSLINKKGEVVQACVEVKALGSVEAADNYSKVRQGKIMVFTYPPSSKPSAIPPVINVVRGSYMD